MKAMMQLFCPLSRVVDNMHNNDVPVDRYVGDDLEIRFLLTVKARLRVVYNIHSTIFLNDTLVDRYVGGDLEIRYLLTAKAWLRVVYNIITALFFRMIPR